MDTARRVVVGSQSLLATFQTCPEQARLELVSPVRKHNDALATGTAVHLHAAARLDGSSYATALAGAAEWLDMEYQRDDFRWVKIKTPETMFAHFEACVAGWEKHVLRQLPDRGLVEYTMSAPLGAPDEGGWQFVLEGTPDYVAGGVVWDWKTSGSEYSAYERTQWAIQPTSYTYLVSQHFEEIHDFTYAVMVKPHGYVQLLDVERGPEDWAWLARIAEGFVRMARTMLDQPWPVIHTHPLCDPKWCPYWDQCRGAYMAGEHNLSISKGATNAR